MFTVALLFLNLKINNGAWCGNQNYDPSTLATEAGGSPWLRPARAVSQNNRPRCSHKDS